MRLTLVWTTLKREQIIIIIMIRICTRTGGYESKWMSRDHLNYIINNIDQNTDKSPEYLRGFAITQTTVRNHWLMLKWKTLKGVAVPLVRYLGPFVKWSREELKQIDQRTRKLLPMHKALHPRDDVDRLYVSRKERGRKLASIEDSVDASIQQREDDIEKHEGGLITAIRNDTDNSVTNIMTINWKQRWEEKQLYGRFKRLINDISGVSSWCNG